MTMTVTRTTEIAIAKSGPRFATLPHEDYQQVIGVVGAYGRLYDDGRIDDFIDLLAPDAVFYPNWPGVAPDEVAGTEDLRSFFSGARAGCDEQRIQPRHHATNPIVTDAGPDRAAVTVCMLYAESREGGACEVKMVGQYDFVLTKSDNRWSIARWSMRYDK